MSNPPIGVVFDCNIFIQSLLNATGPAGQCVQAALDRQVQLFISPYVLDELREAPDKPTPAKLGVTAAKVERLVANLMLTATWVPQTPHVFDHPIDPDDSHYVDLAVATNAQLIVSRDRHLIGLLDSAKPWSAGFRATFSALRIVSPEKLLRMIRSESPITE